MLHFRIIMLKSLQRWKIFLQFFKDFFFFPLAMYERRQMGQKSLCIEWPQLQLPARVINVSFDIIACCFGIHRLLLWLKSLNCACCLLEESSSALLSNIPDILGPEEKQNNVLMYYICPFRFQIVQTTHFNSFWLVMDSGTQNVIFGHLE